MLKVGIVGLANVGKSTLFNALLKSELAESANYAFTTIDPNIGIVSVPDKRLEKLAEIENTITGWSPSAYNKSNVVFTDGKKYGDIQPGDAGVLSYNKFKNVKSRYKGIGHAFIIKSQKGNAVVTIEGNTDSGASREGNGMYEKIRPMNSNLHVTRWNKK